MDILLCVLASILCLTFVGLKIFDRIKQVPKMKENIDTLQKENEDLRNKLSMRGGE